MWFKCLQIVDVIDFNNYYLFGVIGIGNVTVLSMRQAIRGTNDAIVYWCIYASLSLDQLMTGNVWLKAAYTHLIDPFIRYTFQYIMYTCVSSRVCVLLHTWFFKYSIACMCSLINSLILYPDKSHNFNQIYNSQYFSTMCWKIKQIKPTIFRIFKNF